VALVSVFVINLPKYLPIGWRALVGHVDELQASFALESLSGVLLGVVRLGILLLPVIGGTLVTVKLIGLVQAKRAQRRVDPSVAERAVAPEPPQPDPSFPEPLPASTSVWRIDARRHRPNVALGVVMVGLGCVLLFTLRLCLSPHRTWLGRRTNTVAPRRWPRA
jgi:hypothetical protein